MQKQTLSVKGFESPHDAEKISSVLKGVWGIRELETSLSRGEVTFSYDENAASLDDFKQALIDSGYRISSNLQ